jgi:hypothetical protein
MAPNLVARKISFRFSGFKAIHLPMMTSASPYMQDVKSKLIIIVVLEILVYLLRRNRLYPKRCIQVRELDQGEQDAQDRGWEPWFGSRESPSP